jgi:hypothetical protein
VDDSRAERVINLPMDQHLLLATNAGATFISVNARDPRDAVERVNALVNIKRIETWFGAIDGDS